MTISGSAMRKSLSTFRLPAARAHHRRTATVASAALGVLCALAAASACASPISAGFGYIRVAKATLRRPQAPTAPMASAQIASVPGRPIVGRLFAPNSVWNQPLPANAPLDPASRGSSPISPVEAETEGRAGTGPFVQTYGYTTPIYVVGQFQRTVHVAIDTDQNDPLGRLSAGRVQPGADSRPMPALGGHRQPDHDLSAVHQPAVGVLGLPLGSAMPGTPVGAVRSTTCQRVPATTRRSPGAAHCRSGARAPPACRSWRAR